MRAPDCASNWRGWPQRSVAVPSNKRCRKKESNFHRAIIGRVLGLRAIPAIYWCAVRESNPHLLVVGQLFSSIELPTQKLGERTVSAVARELSRGCRSETLRSPLINGAGCRIRTCFVSLKRRVHSRICQSREVLQFIPSNASGTLLPPHIATRRMPGNIFAAIGASHFVRGKLRNPSRKTWWRVQESNLSSRANLAPKCL